jgi:hypothetical protein
MTVERMTRELDLTLERAARSLDFARGIRLDLEARAAIPVPGCLWRC